ncbi:hypothetical protein R3P38DRAFT_769200 [Favolaschia claudopus]|uniref:F-box domain-containing protein n=1 Tax=Favolaschia claudopus TaxID=2862362 RepID=A0AAW0C1Y7_9AGAR
MASSVSRKKCRVDSVVPSTPKDDGISTNTLAAVLIVPPQIVPGAGTVTLVSIPYDIQLEILNCLHPRELLSLGRCCKFTRSFLFCRKDGRSIWKKSLLRITSLPPAPNWLPEPQIAALLFETGCMGCSEIQSSPFHVDWDLRTRFCRNCRKTLVGSFQAGQAPRVVQGSASVPIYHLIPTKLPPNPHASGNFILSHLNAMKAKLSGLQASEVEHFVANKKHQMSQCNQYIVQCKGWLEANRDDCMRRSKAILRKERTQYVRDKLLSLGWAAELASLKVGASALDQHPLVNVAEPLTESGTTCPCIFLPKHTRRRCFFFSLDRYSARARELYASAPR